jgi:hypothetical protein
MSQTGGVFLLSSLRFIQVYVLDVADTRVVVYLDVRLSNMIHSRLMVQQYLTMLYSGAVHSQLAKSHESLS